MTTGLSTDLEHIDDARKTAVINNELLRLQVDIAALQETRLADTGTIKEKDYTFFWRGKAADEIREYGVGFAVKNSMLGKIVPCEEGTERILTIRLNTTDGPITLISAYAPTLYSPEEVKDEFYENLQMVIKKVPSKEGLILLGDFNARVGADQTSWPRCLGHFGVGTMNENGQRLLELCTLHDLCITNTFFQLKPQQKVSWRHPRSKLWHQLDLILTQCCQLRSILTIRTYHSEDRETDHSLVCCKIRTQPKKLHHAKPPGRPRLDISKANDPKKTELLAKTITDALQAKPPEGDAKQRWDHIRNTVYDASFSAFGKKQGKTQDWFEANATELNSVISEKREALLKHKLEPTHSTLQALRAARNKVQSTARRCANDYWEKLCQSIQLAADSGNIRGVYDGIKKAVGPTHSKTGPLKSTSGETITDKSKQMERWVEHYSELYSRESTISDATLEAVEQLPIMEELDEVPGLEELSRAIDRLPTGKAPGLDGIPAEVIKSAKGPLLGHLHSLLRQCWTEGQVPQDMRDCNIVTLYKNKGDRSDCNNYRGISLLSIVGKLFARIALNRLQRLADRVYPESQCGFRAERSTVDMIFSLRQLQEKCREQQQSLYIAFIDLTKAFDLVSRDGLFKVLARIGCPQKLLSITKSFHSGMKAVVQYDGSSSSPFDVNIGVKQGCVLAPTLFGIYFAVMLKHAFRTCMDGIYLHTRSDGKLYNMSRLKAKTKIRRILIRDMLFADDAALTALQEDHLQNLVACFAKACEDFKLTISLKKTEIMGQDTESQPTITINNYRLEVVKEFTYLGSTISDDLSMDSEINRRVGRAASTVSRLSKRVWKNSKLTTKTKMAVYRACVLSALLYGSETWTLYSRHEKRLNTFHMRNLRWILGVKWSDHVTNNDILKRADTPSIYTLLRQRRLRWLGHVHRMQDGRIPKDILYGQLETGKRVQGRPQLRYKDVCKRDMKALNMSVDCWEDLAQDRSCWRQTVKRSTRRGEQQLQIASDERRARRKNSHQTSPATSVFTCSHCGRDCHSRIGLHSHSRRCSTRNSTTAQIHGHQ